MWGASTSSHQIEGGLVNNWTNWEENNVENLIKRTPKDIDPALYKKAQDPDCYLSNSKYSCGSYEHWREDIKVMKEIGLNAYRFSLEWSRIQPEKDIFDDEGIKFYIDLIQELKRNGIEPVITIWHWTLPYWLDEEGGLLCNRFLEYWEKYVTYVLERMGESVTFWITVNEPSVVANMSYLMGVWPPCKVNIFLWGKYHFNIFPKSHNIAYEIIKKKNPSSMVSFAHQGANFEPLKDNVIDRFISSTVNYFYNFFMINLVKKNLDFIALNFYFNNLVGMGGLKGGLFVRKNSNDRCTDVGWWFQPRSLGLMIKKIYSRYSLPVLVTENGLADYRDVSRKEWLDESIGALEECLEEGVDVLGYLHWSLLDNFEWADGFWPQFGLVSIDPESKERKIKDSGYYYRDLIKKYS